MMDYDAHEAMADRADYERKRDREEPGWREPAFVPGDELANFLCQVIECHEKDVWPFKKWSDE